MTEYDSSEQNIRLELLVKKSKFVVVDKDIEDIPVGYSLCTMKYQNSEFRSIIPKSVLTYLGSPGDGNFDDALDKIADFYQDVKKYEKIAMSEGKNIVQCVNWAMGARDAYKSFLKKKLMPDDKNFDKKLISKLCLDDDYVKEKISSLIARESGKTVNAIEDEITNYRRGMKKKIERHDAALIRQYININYIKNPNARLDIEPGVLNGNDLGENQNDRR